ncbi:hypothetical protein CC85DRAFT_287910 [Cutaneotrichosporon oleaginosum]|uniref:Copper acquisition factor BIM1-like domain-containing protein n=1 Tax=Cutaneotrichosporon oleaginosum TaxID=879819 RepID=A0A0J0XG30_9TREE|nr:uncharacterized protein CC85DRAFT_287910 [Cutaneotrichosporon oleaginosum]KLT40033.1 hypothetical protein CC85DRAFT_287910 [Cutaneotrichosporon oleaginosum]TXT13825.1 hypothetical protein COLE_00018 [Cutaneotrichosporon oleaginosum]
MPALESRYAANVQEDAPSAISFIFPEGREPVKGETHKQPCGGSVNGPLTKYPLKGGKLSFGQHEATDNVNFLWSKYIVNDGGDDYEFKTYGEYTVSDLSSGHYCANGPDFAAQGFKAGDKATLMVVFQKDGAPIKNKGFTKRWWFQCADVELVDNWTEPEDFMCGNYYSTNETRVLDAERSMEFTVSPDSRPNGARDLARADARGTLPADDMPAAKAGGIGAGVTAGVFLLALGALWAFGALRFGRKKSVAIRDDASSASSVPVKQVRN